MNYLEFKLNLSNLDNLMVWSYLKDRTGFLPKKYKDAKLEFDKVENLFCLPKKNICKNNLFNFRFILASLQHQLEQELALMQS